jgi:hypothetical protein
MKPVGAKKNRDKKNRGEKEGEKRRAIKKPNRKRGAKDKKKTIP